MNLLSTQLADVASSSQRSNKFLLGLSFALIGLILVLILTSIIASQRAKPKDRSFMIDLGRAFDPSRAKSGALLFVFLFALVGGGYGAYRSFAATCTAYQYGPGGSGVCVQYIQKMLDGAFAGSNYRGGSYITADGGYGPLTTAQVKAYQTFTTYLSADGWVGPKTWYALCSQMSVDYAHRGLYSGQAYNYIVAGYSASKSAGC